LTTIDIHSRVGPDGKLTVSLPPSMANAEVLVSVQPIGPANGHSAPPTTPAPDKPMTQEEWRAFIDRFAGSMPDFPDVERPGPDSYEQREPLD
jgi:hypothetical protein